MITTKNFKDMVKKSTDLRKPRSQAFLKGFSKQKQNLPGENLSSRGSNRRTDSRKRN